MKNQKQCLSRWQYQPTNFGGINCAGENNNFTKLKTALNKQMEGTECPAHILYNTMQVTSGMLSCDVEFIVVQLYNYFQLIQYAQKS